MTSDKKVEMAKKLLCKYRYSKFSRKFQQFLWLFLGCYLVYDWWTMAYQSGWRPLYLSCTMYFVLFVWVLVLRHWIKGIRSIIRGSIIKTHLLLDGVKMDTRVWYVEYIESRSTYQKGSFIFSVPCEKNWTGVKLLFKSERLFMKIPRDILKVGDVITVYVDPQDYSMYWVDVESIFRKKLDQSLKRNKKKS